MTHKTQTLSVKVDPEDWTWFKELAKGFRTQSEAFKALRQVYQGQVVNPVQSLPENNVYQSVCVGDQLPLTWEVRLKEALKEQIEGRKWYVFPDDQVVAIKQKTANGSKSWLEVAIEYPDEVWQAAKTDSRFKNQPITTLNQTLAEYQDKLTKLHHPVIAEALSKGWETTRWHWELPDLVKEAEDYLQLVNQSETLQIQEVYQSVCSNREPLVLSMEDLADRLANKHITLANAKSDKGKANKRSEIPIILTGIKTSNMSEWTAERDPDGLSWQPTDDTRITWVVAQS